MDDRKFLTACEHEMENRGYKRHCRFIWDKMNGVSPAFTVRYSHEYLIWYYKEKLTPVAKNVRGKYLTVFREYRREHSRKPEISYSMIEAFYPDAKRLDVFSRQRRKGWKQYGDQINHFI